MSIKDLVIQLSLINLTPSLFSNQSFTKVLATDSLETALQKMDLETLWITANQDPSILSVAYFKQAAAILLSNVDLVDPIMIDTASQKKIILLSSPESTFTVCGRLYGLI